MTEVITDISEWQGDVPVYDSEGGEMEWKDHMEGFHVATDKQVIALLISDRASCCESWGFFLTEDDPTKFIGADLRGVKVTDTNRSARQFFNGWKHDYDYEDPNQIGLDSGGVMFVDIETNRGVLQFVAYNCHNGYYGHEARVTSQQLTHSETL